MRWAFAASFVLFAVLARADWTPPASPDPQGILREIDLDFRDKRYADALAKHVWFHENVLKIEPSYYGVRLSFALASWVKLGAVYPPALERLRNIRDEAARRVREGERAREAFHDFSSINRGLEEDGRTTELFVWLNFNRPLVAREVFEIAQPALIKAREYRLCGAYIEAGPSFQRILERYRRDVRFAKEEPERGRQMEDFAEKSFSHGTATLVALLTLNERTADAERVASEALKEWNNPQFKEQLERSKRGEVPAPWP